MIISPKLTQAIRVATPKISKNRLVSDFCLKFDLYVIRPIDLLFVA